MTSFATADGPFCGRCGAPDDGHPECAQALILEPPRYCTVCRRRLIVQVFPVGWRARCSAHGDVQPAT